MNQYADLLQEFHVLFRQEMEKNLLGDRIRVGDYYAGLFSKGANRDAAEQQEIMRLRDQFQLEDDQRARRMQEIRDQLPIDSPELTEQADQMFFKTVETR